jgi:hypothetical protein
MNIFFLDKNPMQSSVMYGDKHVGKIILEIAQMCSTALHRHGLSKIAPYKEAYQNHPMTRWVGDSSGNFEYAVTLATGLSNQWHHRVGTSHKSIDAIIDITIGGILSDKVFKTFPKHDFTLPPLCMPDEYKSDNYSTFEQTVESYRRYYTHAKSAMHEWTNVNRPKFIQENLHREVA